MEEQDVIKRMLIKIHEFEIHDEEPKYISEEETKVYNAINEIRKLALNELKIRIEEILSCHDLSKEKKKEYIRILNIEKNNLLPIV